MWKRWSSGRERDVWIDAFVLPTVGCGRLAHLSLASLQTSSASSRQSSKVPVVPASASLSGSSASLKTAPDLSGGWLFGFEQCGPFTAIKSGKHTGLSMLLLPLGGASCKIHSRRSSCAQASPYLLYRHLIRANIYLLCTDLTLSCASTYQQTIAFPCDCLVQPTKTQFILPSSPIHPSIHLSVCLYHGLFHPIQCPRIKTPMSASQAQHPALPINKSQRDQTARP